MARNSNNHIVTFAENASTTYQANNGIVKTAAAWDTDADNMRKKGAIPGTGASSIQMNTAVQQASIGSAILCGAITDTQDPITDVTNLTATPGSESNTGWQKAAKNLSDRLYDTRKMKEGDIVVPKANNLTQTDGTNLLLAESGIVKPQGTVNIGAYGNTLNALYANNVFSNAIILNSASQLYNNGWTDLSSNSFFFVTRAYVTLLNVGIPSFSYGYWVGNTDKVIGWTEPDGSTHTHFFNSNMTQAEGYAYKSKYSSYASYASEDQSKGTIEERLTRLGFRSGNALIFKPTSSVTYNYLKRQGNYVIGRLEFTLQDASNSVDIVRLPDDFRPAETVNCHVQCKYKTQSSVGYAYNKLEITTQGLLSVYLAAWPDNRPFDTFIGIVDLTLGYEAAPITQ